MKCLITAAGGGTRLGELTQSKNKCMMQINGKNIIEYQMDYASQFSEELVIVVGFKAEQIMDYYGNTYKGLKITYVRQWEQKGLVHAISCAHDEIAGSAEARTEKPFFLLLGDEVLIGGKHKEMLEKFYEEPVIGVCGVIQTTDTDYIKKTYTILLNDDDTINQVVEKPQTPFNNLMGTGNWIFSSKIFDYIEKTHPMPGFKEKMIGPLMQTAIDAGEKMKWSIICDRFANINTEYDISLAKSFLK